MPTAAMFAKRLSVLVSTSAAIAFGCLVTLPAAAQAATLTVTTTADEFSDPGPGAGCSLREAVEAANTDGTFGGCAGADNAGDNIHLSPGATYVRTRTGVDDTNEFGDIDITAEAVNMSTAGPGDDAIIEGDGTAAGDRVLDVSGSASFAFILGVSFRNGVAGADGGGGIRVTSGPILSMLNSTISGNAAVAAPGGGVLVDSPANTTLRNVTISGNSAGTDGGGLATTMGTTTLNSATVASNTADSDDSDTGSGGGIAKTGGTLNFRNTLIGNNSDLSNTVSAPDCAGGPTSLDHNLIENTGACGFAPSANDITGQDPVLGPLAVNDGPSNTHALLNGSPALEEGNPATPGLGGNACEGSDQRGIPRPMGPLCDIGAYERRPAPSAPPAIGDTDPDSPGSDPTPLVKGTSSPDSVTIEVFAQSNCQGPAASATSGAFQSSGILVSVAQNTTNQLSARALSIDGAASACSSDFPYIHNSGVPVPTITSTNPPSGSNENEPFVIGSGADPGATVEIYAAGDCGGVELATGTGVAFGSTGLQITVADDSSTALVVRQTDGLGNESPCSGVPFTYNEVTTPAQTPITTPITPVTPVTPPSTPAPVKCRKGQKLKNGRCVKKRKKKK